MKKFVHIVTLIITVIVIKFSIYAEVNYNPVQIYISEVGPDIISYSDKWNTQEKLKQIFDELYNNFHSDEINSLKYIYIYPNSPYGIRGAYYESSILINNNKYLYGDNAYIEIFNGDEYDLQQIASVLAHEYGHHFTFYYLINSENKYYNQWYNTEYARIRQLHKYKDVDYGTTNEYTYRHEWDITEILAEDYVQLFGSPLAKTSTDFKDITECLEENIMEYYIESTYNSLPQENLNLPLATEVDGLYNYWLNLAGYTSNQPTISKKPIPYLKNSEVVYFGNNIKYTIAWDEILDGNIYEYTLIMYPTENPYFPVAIKTVVTGEEMSANLGSDVKYNEKDELYGILECMEGEYEIKLFIKDSKGFIFSSEILYYDFTAGVSRYNENVANNIVKIKEFEKIPFEFKPLVTIDKYNLSNQNVSQQTSTKNVLANIKLKHFILNNYYKQKTLSYKLIPISIKKENNIALMKIKEQFLSCYLYLVKSKANISILILTSRSLL